MFSAAVTDTLEWAGWSPTRKVSMTRWVKALIDDGYTMVPEALRILENFGLLTIKPPPKAPGAVFRADELVFRPDDAALGESDAIGDWEKQLGVRLSPVAEHGGQGLLLVAEDGRVYLCFGALMWKMGETFEDALENTLIVVRREPERIPCID